MNEGAWVFMFLSFIWEKEKMFLENIESNTVFKC